nr:MAG TPA: hypothetical protein [Caudoviricetes sp.]
MLLEPLVCDKFIVVKLQLCVYFLMRMLYNVTK